MKTGTRAMRLMGSLLVFGLVTPLLTGCGGGGTAEMARQSATATNNTGRAVLQVAWPALTATRVIPRASRFLEVQILNGDTLVARRLLERPTEGRKATVTFEGLPVGQLRVVAAAFATDDTTVSPQAVGATPLETIDGKAVSFKITLQSTITQLQVQGVSSPAYVDRPLSVYLVARDAKDAVIPLSPAQLAWKVTEGKAFIDENGTILPRTAGTLRITVTDTESGLTTNFTASVLVLSPPPAPPS